MRGAYHRSDGLFSYVRPDSRVPKNYPRRKIRQLADEVLVALPPQFDALYSEIGRPSIPPVQLLRALLLRAFYSIRSERQLMEELDYNHSDEARAGSGAAKPSILTETPPNRRYRLEESRKFDPISAAC